VWRRLRNNRLCNPILSCLLLLLFLSVLPQPAQAFWGSEITLDKAAKQLAQDLVKTGNLEGIFVQISPQDLYDAETQLSLPLASQLRNLLVTEMTKAGARVLVDGADEETFMLLQGTWAQRGDDLAIDLKVMRLTEAGPEVISAASAKVPMKYIDQSSLTPDKASWARYMIRQVSENMAWQTDMTVHLPPFKINGQRCSDELGSYLSGWLRPALAESGILRPIDQRQQLKDVQISTLRTRGTRGIRPNVPNADEQSLTASILNADAELKGDFYLGNDTVEIRTRLINSNGEQISAASAEIPKGLFPENLFIPAQIPKDAPLTVSQLTAVCVTGSGLELDLTSTRGEDRPYYQKGEEIRFMMRLNRPAWVYLFDLNPAGEAILLYPVDDRGHLARDVGFMREIEKPLILPEDGYSYELIADAPYGTDTVWAVASETPLDFPANMGGDWSRAENLVGRLRNQGTRLQRGYAEARLELVTGR
jgi:hypothetical protein